MKSEPSVHIPVLLREIINLLVTDTNGIYFDGTLGDGGYTRALLKELDSQGRVIAVDWDEKSVEYSKKWALSETRRGRLSIHRANFCKIKEVLSIDKISAVNGIVLDLGLSSRQLDTGERGFSHRLDGPLDMRMDNRLTDSVSHIVSKYSEKDLKEIFFKYGEERGSAKLARIIIRERQRQTIVTTNDLVTIMKKYWRPKFFVKSASRIFQALRIAVNHELENLEKFLEICWDLLLPGGKIAVVSYHSLEDRIVKNVYRKHEDPCICHRQVPVCQCGKIPDAKIITKKPVRASSEEKIINPRSRSAKLRVAEKIEIIPEDS